MKIITNDAVYIQKYDIEYLYGDENCYPKFIFEKLDDLDFAAENKYDFVRYDAPDEMEYLKKLDILADYGEMNNLSEYKLINNYNVMKLEENKLLKDFDKMSMEEKRNHIDTIVKCDTLKFKMESIENMILFKQGNIDMKLPAGVKENMSIKKLVKALLKLNA